MFDLEQLSEILRNERELNNLQELPASIENDITDYLNKLKTAQDECSDYRELSMVRDEYKNAMILIEGIVERRFAKLVNYAVISITNQHPVSMKITSNDKIVFESLYNQMKELRNNMQLANCLVVKI